MKARYDIVQGTTDWHQARWGKVGGTLAKGLFVNSDTLLFDVLSECLEEYQESDGYTSSDMLRGIELEPEARNRLSEYCGITFNEVGWIESTQNSLIGISPDGISECETIQCEIKCPGSKKHLKTLLENAIPDDNSHQCIHAFTVNEKLEKLYFCSFRPESIKSLFVFELTRETQITLGTKAKPVTKSVSEWSSIALNESFVLSSEIKKAIEKLSF
jgi:hypothetical protein